MGRIARVVIPGIPHHITQRGNHRENVFFTDADRSLYLSILAAHARQYGARILGFCLMSNHVHLVAVPEAEDSLAKAFGRTHNDYARWLHVRQGRGGHLWQNRFFSCPLDAGHCWAALRYVEVNPVRAGLTAVAEEWAWSSARAHVTGVDPHGLIDLKQWSACWTPEVWRDVLVSGVEEGAMADRLRQATRTGRPLGAEGFADSLERVLGRSVAPQKRGPKPRLSASGFGE
ncbi:MAG TPA: transposase [Bryobacteraceae bacterium]|nr:transposase [Bryobacteraceae bacterium]